LKGADWFPSVSEVVFYVLSEKNEEERQETIDTSYNLKESCPLLETLQSPEVSFPMFAANCNEKTFQ
jgi:hypothetical protein